MRSDNQAGGQRPCTCNRCKANGWTDKLIKWLPTLINLAVHALDEWLRWAERS
jgi:hypothetical protein